MSPAFPFIKERLTAEFERLDREKITPWAFLNTSQGVSIEAPDGRSWRYSGIAFGGSVRDEFWGQFLRPFTQDLTARAFEQTRALCERHHLNSFDPFEETALQLRRGLENCLTRMVDIDRRLRGQGYPDTITAHEPGELRNDLHAVIRERLLAEQALPVKADKEPTVLIRFLSWLSKYLPGPIFAALLRWLGL